MSERVFRVFVHGVEAFQVHLSPGDEVIANGTDVGIVQPDEKTPFDTTAATAEAVRGVKFGKETGVEIAAVAKSGRKAPKAKPANRRKADRRKGPKAKSTKKAPRKTARRKAPASRTTKVAKRVKVGADKGVKVASVPKSGKRGTTNLRAK